MIAALIWLLTSATASFADTPQHWTPWPATGTLYLEQSKCPAPCYPVVSAGGMIDLSIAKLQSGQLVEDSVKKAARDTKSASDLADDSARKTSKDAARATLKGFDKTKVKDLSDALDIIEKLVKAEGLDQ